MLIEAKKLINECKDCIITGVAVLSSILTDGQKKTLRNIIINISFFAGGYAISEYLGLSELATMVVAFTSGRYAAILDNHLGTALTSLPAIVQAYWRKRNG